MGFFSKLKKAVSDVTDAVKSAVESTATSAKQLKADFEAAGSKDWHIRLNYYLSQANPDNYCYALRLIDFHQCQEPNFVDTWKSAIKAHPEMAREIFSKTYRFVTSDPVIWKPILDAHFEILDNTRDNSLRNSIIYTMALIQCLFTHEIDAGKKRLELLDDQKQLLSDLDLAVNNDWVHLEEALEKRSKLYKADDASIKTKIAHRIADYAMMTDEWDRAIECLSRASREIPDDGGLKWHRSILYREQQNWERYAEILETELIPEVNKFTSDITGIVSADIYEELIHIYKNYPIYKDIAKQEARIFEFCKALFELDHSNKLTHDCLIKTYEKDEKWDDLITVLSHIASDSEPPQKSQLYCRIAKVYHEKLDSPDSAIDYGEKSLEADAHNAECIDLLLELYRKQEEWNKLVELLRKKADLVINVDEQLTLLKEAAHVARDNMHNRGLASIIWNHVLLRDISNQDALIGIENFCNAVKAPDDNTASDNHDNTTTETPDVPAEAPQEETENAFLKSLKYISGVQAYQQRKSSIANKEEADKLKQEIETRTKSKRDNLNGVLESFGKFRLEAMHNTVGTFLTCLERLGKKYNDKEYEFLKNIDLSENDLAAMNTIDMQATDALKTLGVAGGFGAVALAGTPILVTQGVVALGAASTGTAISSLSGVAATNATLAWLGGGSIAAGGGGMAAGAAVLTGITVGATASVALLALGVTASAFYSKKNTESEQYLADVSIWAAQSRQSWVAIDAIKSRIFEMQDITRKLELRSLIMFDRLKALVDSFDPHNIDHVAILQQCGILAKSMSELAQTPIIDKEGNFNEFAKIVITNTEKVLNKDLT